MQMPTLSTSKRIELWQDARFKEYLTNKELRQALIGDGSIITHSAFIRVQIMQQFVDLTTKYDGDIEGVLDDAEIPTEYSTPITDADRYELTYLRDLHKLCEDMRTALICMKDVDTKVHRIQGFLRVKDSMDWQGYESYGETVSSGSGYKESINK